MKDIKIYEKGRWRLSFAWYDLWAGVFIDTKKKKIYFCFFTILITFNFGGTNETAN